MTAIGFHSTDTAPPGRILAVDLARAGALLAMAVFHFVYDLELFGWVAPGTAVTGAGGVLALHGGVVPVPRGGEPVAGPRGGIRWRGFWRRFVLVAGAAAVISARHGSRWGGVHLLRHPARDRGGEPSGPPGPARAGGGAAGAAALAFAAPSFARAEVFDPWWFWWTGLQTVSVRSVDYVPLAPWFGPFLLGLALGRAGSRFGLWSRLAAWRGGALGGASGAAGAAIRSGSTWRISRC
jgi:uncharacterized membrane protein